MPDEEQMALLRTIQALEHLVHAPRTDGDPDAWLAGVLESVARTVRADKAALLLVEADRALRLAGHWGFEPTAGLWGFDFAATPSDIQRAFDDARARFSGVSDPDAARLLGLGDVEAYLSVPLVRAGGPSGLLVVAWHATPGSLPPADVALVEVAAHHLASELAERVAADERRLAEREAVRAKDLYALLSAVNQVIVRSDSRPAMLQAVCDALVAHPGVVLAWLGWVDEQAGTLRAEVWQGAPEAVPRALRIQIEPVGSPTDSPANRALREGTIQVVDDLARKPIHRPGYTRGVQAGLRSYAVVPLRHRGQRGLLGVVSAQVGFFRADAVALLRELGGDLEFGLEHLAAAAELSQKGSELRTLFETVADGLVVVDQRGRIELANPAAQRLFGRPAHELVGAGVDTLLSRATGDRLRGGFDNATLRRLRRATHNVVEAVGERADGSLFPMEVRLGEARTRLGPRFVAVLRDVGRERAAIAQHEFAASHDPHTGLWNRTGLWDRLRRVGDEVRDGAADRLVLALIDLDRFQQVNEALGPAEADRVLISFARGLERASGAHGFVARTGGDEFALLAPLPPGEAAGSWVSGVLRAAAARTGRLGRMLGASAGVVILPEDGVQPETVIPRADLALHVAKASPAGTVRLYTAEMEQEEARARALPNRLREAIDRDELALFYQPQVDMATGRVRGFEALLRWHHPEQGLLAPGAFLPSLRDERVIEALGEWVIDRALRQWREWSERGVAVRLSVNVAPEHFLAEGFARRLRRRLRAHDALGSDALEVEITESTALSDPDRARAVMREVQQLGTRVALDDFGTGYASIASLADLPFDTIKMDQTFTRNMLRSARGWALGHAIVLLGLAAEREVVAEGVEEEALEEALLRVGARIGQGYLYGRPIPADEVPTWLGAWALRPPRRTPAAAGRAEVDYVPAVLMHLHWVARVLAAVAHPAVTLEPDELHARARCRFWRWCERYGDGRPEIERLAQAHQASHAEALDLLGAGADPQARAAFAAHAEAFLADALDAFYPGAINASRPAPGRRYSSGPRAAG